MQKAQLEYEKEKYQYEDTARIEAERLLAEERQDIRDEQKEAAEQVRDQQLEDAETLIDLASEEGDNAILSEANQLLHDIEGEFTELELRSLFTGEHDERDAVCHIQSGEGGTEAQDWAEMLLRMYQRWAEQKGLSFEVTAVSEGTEAGISSAEFIVTGRRAYGMLQSEHGVHRLVRISPFDSGGDR